MWWHGSGKVWWYLGKKLLNETEPRSMAFIPAAIDLHLFVNIARVRIVAPVVPSPARSLVAFATCFYKTDTNILDLVLKFNALSNSYSIW